jgi:radical SAM protein with 4Fe4S-binding SPASM domain
MDIIDDSFPNFLRDDKRYIINGEHNNHCDAFVNTMSIFANGNISICSLDIGLFNHPNIFIDGLDKCLDYISNFELNKIKFPSKEFCNECDHLNFCNNCYVRGAMKFRDINEKCKWGSTGIGCKKV